VKRIIVFEDDEKLGGAIKAFLEEYNCQPIVVPSGKGGLELVKKGKPNLILMDLLMPGIHGFDLCKILKENEETKHIPIIVMSAVYNPSTVIMELEDSGANEFIKKPFEFSALLELIESFIYITLE